MTSTLPQEARDAFAGFLTTEYTTIDSRQQPIVWPVTPYYSDGAETIDVTTGIGYPKKANDARRNPQVSLLFSEPHGSTTPTTACVLVQGTADVDDRDLDANRDRYWRESGQKLPATKDMHPPAFMRKLMAWYYARVYVKVRPERVFVWPDGDCSKEPDLYGADLEEVRSGHIEKPLAPHEPAEGGAVRWDERIEQLGERYPKAVLSWVGPDGFPLSARLPVSLDSAARKVRLGAEPAGLPLTEGRVSLVAHSHGPNFEWQENFQLRGDLARDGDGWALTPHRLVGGLELPDESRLALMRRNFSKAMRYGNVAREELRKRKERAG